MVTPVPIDEEEEYDHNNLNRSADRSGGFIDDISFKGGGTSEMFDDASGVYSQNNKSGYGGGG